MRIGFDAKRVVANGTGLGSYGRTLVNDLAALTADSCELRLYAPDRGKEELRKMVNTSPAMSFVYPHHLGDTEHPSLITKIRGDYWRTHGIVADLQHDGVALYHGLSGELPIGIRKTGIRTVVTIHDLIFMRHPEYYNWIDTKVYVWKFRKTIAEADRIIAISECTKRDIMYYGNIGPEKIDLIYQSCGTRFKVQGDLREAPEHLRSARRSKGHEARRRYHLPERYIINVGTIEERKNILLAVKALQHLPEEIALVIIGHHTPYTDKVEAYVKEHSLDNRVFILHNVTNDDLPALYQGAEVCVYPSRYEGFGIPIIEAIQSGLPVVACTGSCLEEAGGPDNIYVDPDDVEGMAHGISMSLKGNKDREERISRSQDYIRRFENSNVAAQVLDVYKKLL